MNARASLADVVAVVAGALTFGAVFVIAVLARRPVGRPIEALADAGRARRVTPRAWRVAGVVSGVLVAVVVAGVVGAVLVALSAFAIPRLWRRRRAARDRLTARAAMPDAVELFVLCVHAGRSPPQAIAELARAAPLAVRDAFGAVELQLHRGRTLADALAELPQLVGPPGRELAVAIATADRDGLPMAPVLDRLAAEARAERRRAGEAAARGLPVRLSFPLVACTLPSFVLLAIAPAVLGALSTLRDRAP